jgi:flavin-dependent dehydrogenase
MPEPLDDAPQVDTARVTDVAVIGGGPAGSTAAILLAERGYKVTVFEKTRHPRFHIGESLLPANLPLLERLGVADQIRAIGMEKRGAEFVSPSHGRGETFLFAEAWDKTMPYAYQVRRSEFDEILFRHAARRGATTLEDCRVRQVSFADGSEPVRIETEHKDGTRETWSARFVVDASGRDTFLANKFGAKRRNTKHNSAAVYAHFTGAERYTGERAGLITVYWFDHGWLWFIPLADGTTSIGAVAWPYYMKTRTDTVQDFFLATIQLCEPLAKRLTHATLVSEVYATGNYSYSATHSHGDRYLLLGDAYAFIDPVFSSGVWLAMQSAAAGAEAIDVCLRKPARAVAALHRFDRAIRRGPREFSWFIYRVSHPTMREMFMRPGNPLRMKEAMLSVLAGDIFGRTPIWPSVAAFKGLFFANLAVNLRNSLAAARNRRRNIADAEASSGPR